MHHYLEHTREPGAELDAAATVLEEGGHLLIEVPAPESTLARRLGWLWGPWLQPQHQHFVPAANLVAALERRGFRVRGGRAGEVHQPVDLGYAVMLLANRLAPAAPAPWDPPATAARRLARASVYAALLPLAGAGGGGRPGARPGRPPPPRALERLPGARPQGLTRAGRGCGRPLHQLDDPAGAVLGGDARGDVPRPGPQPGVGRGRAHGVGQTVGPQAPERDRPGLTPRLVTRWAQNCWSVRTGTGTAGTPARRPEAVVPAAEWWTTAAHRGISQSCGTSSTVRMSSSAADSPASPACTTPRTPARRSASRATALTRCPWPAAMLPKLTSTGGGPAARKSTSSAGGCHPTGCGGNQ